MRFNLRSWNNFDQPFMPLALGWYMLTYMEGLTPQHEFVLQSGMICNEQNHYFNLEIYGVPKQFLETAGIYQSLVFSNPNGSNIRLSDPLDGVMIHSDIQANGYLLHSGTASGIYNTRSSILDCEYMDWTSGAFGGIVLIQNKVLSSEYAFALNWLEK